MKDIMLLDYENFQPENLSILKGKATKVFVFVGAKQKKLPLKFALSAQALGQKVEYVEVARSGKNALDFHIAFHLGRLAEHTPKSRFVIVSKDTGFDPLIGHLKDQGLVAKRIPSLAKLAPNCSTRRSSKDEKLAAIVANLHARGAARPRKRQALENSIAQFMKSLSAQERCDLIQRLCDEGYLAIENEAVTYKQPITHWRKSSAA